MFKIFFHSVFSLFLILFLFLNVVYFFNISTIFHSGVNPIDLSGKYFGFSSLVKFFQTGFENDTFFSSFRSILQSLMGSIRSNLIGCWEDFSSSGGIYSLSSFFVAVGNFFRNMFAILTIIPFLMMDLIYMLFAIVWVFLKLTYLVGGGYALDVPTSPYDSILNPLNVMMVYFPKTIAL